MKYTKYLWILAATACMTSCDEEFLNKVPTANASEEAVEDAIKRDPSAVQGYITGYYRNLIAPEAQASHDDFGLKAFELATDLMGSDMTMIVSDFFINDHLLTNRQAAYRRPRTCWQELYAVINGANEVISKLKPLEEKGDATIERMLGQSYTIRAYMYYWLINLYQQPYQWTKDKPGIPLYTEETTRLERVPVKEVYDQILADIDKGYKLLKGKKSQSKSELNEYAAAAIYANVLAFVNDYPKQWEEVAKYAVEATKGGKLFSTEEEFLSGFNDLGMSEAIWGADIDAENNTFYGSLMSHMDSYGPGYADTAYKMIASDLYDKIAENDVRKKWFGMEITDKKNPHYKVQQYVQRKFLDVSTTGTGDVFCSDYIFFRVAEMYFMAAEAYYNNNQPAEAKTMLETVMKTRIPDYTCEKSGEELLEEIKIQKRIEMWGEGRRLFDMKRRGEDLDRSKAINHNSSSPTHVEAGDKRFIYQIPNAELNANSAIKEQNP